MRILVVEDEKTLCTSIANGLRIDGYEVDTCFNGDDAWDMALSESYTGFNCSGNGRYGFTAQYS